MDSGTNNQVKDAYATLSERPHETHPFTVYLRYTDGTHSQPINCRDLRSCLQVGNGMLSALAAMDIHYEAVNVVFDPRFEKAASE